MRALVTGGCGFIGSHVVEQLVADGVAVTVLDNLSTGRESNLDGVPVGASVRLVRGSVTDPEAVADAMRDVTHVFHLAALADIVPSIVDPTAYYVANVTGTIVLAEAARRQQVQKFVYAASSSCYGIPDSFPTPETAEIRPQYPYALTKRLGEEIALHWHQVYGLPVVSLRLFNVYGPRSRTAGTYGAVFGVFLAQKIAGIPMTVVGDGEQTRDFTYVTDVARAFVAAGLSNLSGEVMNVGSGGTYSVNHLTSLLGGDVVHIPKRPGEPDMTFADTARIEDLLGWKAAVSFEDGVKNMILNLDYWRDAPVWDPASIQEATKDWFRFLGAEEDTT